MTRTALLASLLLAAAPPVADDIDKKYPLGPQLRVLAQDVRSPAYRRPVTEKMLSTDLAAEWQRVATEDNPESFLAKHGGKGRVLADADLRRAYQRRVQIRADFLDLMRAGYKRYKQAPPFDRGATPEPPGTLVKKAGGPRLALEVVPPAPGAERHWPRFRGPSGQGLTGQKLPVRWDKDGTNVVWRVKVPQPGNSSPVLWDDRTFLTGATPRGTGRFVYCFRKSDGKLLWSRRAPEKGPEPGVRPKNGYASATPVTDGERLIVFLGSCGVLCYDFEGKLLWKYADLRFDTTHGTGSSPVLYKDKVILVHDQNRAASIFLALDKRSGKLLWRRPRARAMTWCTPVVVRAGGRDELVFAGGGAVKGYDPDSGKELWSASGATVEVIPTVVVGNGPLYSASGRNGPVLALRPGGAGDVTATHLAWRAVRVGPHVPSPLYLDGRLYTVNDHGIVACLDAEAGKLLWQHRLPSAFSASPVEAGGLIYLPGESGVTFVLRGGDRFELVARNDLGAPILASPAAVDNRLFLRTQTELVCIGEGAAR
jgi:outer membrane protein assembly factor BamB